MEVKDHSNPETAEAPLAELPLTVARKVVAPLGGLVAARLKATDPEERALASDALSAQTIRVVLHVEWPSQPCGRLANVQSQEVADHARFLAATATLALTAAFTDATGSAEPSEAVDVLVRLRGATRAATLGHPP